MSDPSSRERELLTEVARLREEARRLAIDLQEAIRERDEAREALRGLLERIESPEWKSAFISAWVHGSTPSDECMEADDRALNAARAALGAHDEGG